MVWIGAPWVVHRPPPAAQTPVGDLELLVAPDAGDATRLDALERTVERIRWVPRNPGVRRALAARAGTNEGGACSIDTVKRQELRAAVYLVLAERARPQAHRFGRSWVTGADGRVAEVTTAGLPLQLYWRWFCDEVRKAAESSVLGESYPVGASAVGGNRVLLGLDELPAACLDLVCPDASPDPLEALLAGERRRDATACWHLALDEATPRQRELLMALAELDDAPPAGTSASDASGAPTLAAAAARLGMAPSTARVQWQRLVQRVRTRAAKHPVAGAWTASCE